MGGHFGAPHLQKPGGSGTIALEDLVKTARARLADAAAREAFETEAAREVGGGLGALLRYPSPVPQQVARETLR